MGKFHEQRFVTLQWYLLALFDVHGFNEGVYSRVVMRRKVYGANSRSVYVKLVVALTACHVFHLGRKRYFRQTHLPVAFEFYLVGEFRRVTGHRVVGIVVCGAVGRQGHVKATIHRGTISSTHELNLLG